MKIAASALLAILVVLPSLLFAQQKPAPIAPAEKLTAGWEEIDQRLVFLMVRLANVETSLEAVEKAIGAGTRKKSAKTGAGKKADRENEAMDRKGGGPMRWFDFYGTTAEKFFYHPTDRNSTYHTTTVLRQQGSQADNKVGGGVPASQGVPVHQRPPQFDYIYRANEKAKERAEEEAAELKGKIDELTDRRHRLEAEQAGLWCEVAFRAVSHYDLDKKPLYRFEPLIVSSDTESRQHAETAKAAASFMALALSIIGEAQKDQATTFSKIKPAMSEARQSLNDGWLRLGVDVTDRKSTEGQFAALAKRLDDVASNLSDSYVVANEGDQAKDQQRKDTFRALLQESLVSYAQIILALDEMSVSMKNDWKITPDVDKPIQFVNLANVEAVRPAIPPAQEVSSGGSNSPTIAAKPKVDLDLAYTKAKDQKQTLDVYAPAQGKRLPIVFWIHGGGWQAGDKADVQAKPQAFVDKGFVFVSTNYRLLPTVTIQQIAGDVARAIRWTYDHARDYGGDPSTIFVMGHSSGAQLAALVSTDDRYLKAVGLPLSITKGCVPVDGDTYDVPMQIATVEQKVAAIYRKKFGDEKSQRDLSPVTHVAKGKNIPPFLLLHVADNPETRGQAQRLARALQESGVSVSAYPAEGKSHTTINAELGLTNDKPTQEMFEFVTEVLKRTRK